MTATIAPHVFNNAANAWGECHECGEPLATTAHADGTMQGSATLDHIRAHTDPSFVPEWRRRAMITAARSGGNFAARDTTTPTR